MTSCCTHLFFHLQQYICSHVCLCFRVTIEYYAVIKMFLLLLFEHSQLIVSFLECVPIRATVHIQVNDINEYSPVFKEKSYKATVIEGKKYDSILKVEAVDADCSFQFSQICNYEIVTPDVPFTVDKDGKDCHQAAWS